MSEKCQRNVEEQKKIRPSSQMQALMMVIASPQPNATENHPSAPSGPRDGAKIRRRFSLLDLAWCSGAKVDYPLKYHLPARGQGPQIEIPGATNRLFRGLRGLSGFKRENRQRILTPSLGPGSSRLAPGILGTNLVSSHPPGRLTHTRHTPPPPSKILAADPDAW